MQGAWKGLTVLRLAVLAPYHPDFDPILRLAIGLSKYAIWVEGFAQGGAAVKARSCQVDTELTRLLDQEIPPEKQTTAEDKAKRKRASVRYFGQLADEQIQTRLRFSNERYKG